MKQFIQTVTKGVLIMSLFTYILTSNNTTSADTRLLSLKQSAENVLLSTNQKESLQSAANKVLPTVVTIEINKPVNTSGANSSNMSEPYELQGHVDQKVGAGSGFVVSKNGYIVTNKHVVLDTEARYDVVQSDGTTNDAIVVYKDPNYDIAILKVNDTFDQVAKLGNSSKLSIGQPVAAIGNAYGQTSNVITSGSVFGLNKSITAQGDGIVEDLKGLVESSTSIVPGFSGGPLIDAHGNIVGINVATDANKVHSSYSIPIDKVKNILQPYTR